MRTLIHYRKQQLELFLVRISKLNSLYIERAYALNFLLLEFIEDTITLFNQIGESNKSAKISQLKLYLETAKKGINPQTLEKLKTGKRENIWIASYHLLNEMSSLFQEMLMIENTKITVAVELVEQVILSAIQSNFIDKDRLDKLKGQNDIAKLWHELAKNEQVKLIEIKLKLTITQDDIFILCDKVFSNIRN